MYRENAATVPKNFARVFEFLGVVLAIWHLTAIGFGLCYRNGQRLEQWGRDVGVPLRMESSQATKNILDIRTHYTTAGLLVRLLRATILRLRWR